MNILNQNAYFIIATIGVAMIMISGGTDLSVGQIIGVIGVGINVNQETFRSDAPNPVSLINVLGHETELRPLLRQITERFAMEYDCLRDDKEFIRSRYLQHLWRLEGKHPYRDKDGEFMAEVVRVENDGHLVLRDAQGRERSYAFGEVDAVL